MKTKEELNAIKEEAEALNKKLETLTEEELKQVCGYGSLKGYYCNNDGCSKYGVIVSPTIDNKCQACHATLQYGPLIKKLVG